MALISEAARDLIVAAEVSSKQTYEARYRRPEWPGGASGITIGIGYDVGAGVKSSAQLRDDWGGKIPDAMIEALIPCIGIQGNAAHAMLPRVRPLVDVPWSAAIAVFDETDVPRWYATCKRKLPNFELLSSDCKGALVSLAYNRGPSFDKDGDRYAEMRNIKTHMEAKNYGAIPDEFRKMKRLWASPSMRGLVIRREQEAKLFERGLGAKVLPPPDIPVPKPKPPKKPVDNKVAGGAVVAGGGAVATAAASGMSAGKIAALVAALAALGFIAWLVVRSRGKK